MNHKISDLTLTVMTEELKSYLQKVFFRDNHAKYRKYFDMWLNALTPAQIEGAKLWMYWEQSGNLAK